MVPLYKYRVNTSVMGAAEFVGCFSCRDHARWAAQGRGVSPLVMGEPFTDLGSAGQGECEHCAYTERAVERAYRKNGFQ
jgi:hypothetical protein